MFLGMLVVFLHKGVDRYEESKMLGQRDSLQSSISFIVFLKFLFPLSCVSNTLAFVLAVAVICRTMPTYREPWAVFHQLLDLAPEL
jgi:hypothetical protein